jgi:hypothetical protein
MPINLQQKRLTGKKIKDHNDIFHENALLCTKACDSFATLQDYLVRLTLGLS